jgi:hypothetical protein
MTGLLLSLEFAALVCISLTAFETVDDVARRLAYALEVPPTSSAAAELSSADRRRTITPSFTG